MELPHYPSHVDDSRLQYTFISVGPKGEIEKVVVFTPWGDPEIYNLGFGDRMAGTTEIDDLAVTDNGDMLLIIATVAAIADDFLQNHIGASLFIAGSTPSRTRLYRMLIGRNMGWLRNSLIVLGLTQNEWEPFRPNRAYDAFYVTRTV